MKATMTLILVLMGFAAQASESSFGASVKCNTFQGKQVVDAVLELDFSPDAKQLQTNEAAPQISDLVLTNVGASVGLNKHNEAFSIQKLKSKKWIYNKRTGRYDVELVIAAPVNIYNGADWTLRLVDVYKTVQGGLSMGAFEDEESGGYLFAYFSTGSDDTKLLCRLSF